MAFKTEVFLINLDQRFIGRPGFGFGSYGYGYPYGYGGCC